MPVARSTPELAATSQVGRSRPRNHRWLALAATLALAAPATAPAAGAPELLTSGLQGGSGSAVGPGGALFVTEPAAGRITRVDTSTGAKTTFAEGLPQTLPWVGLGGLMDVAFLGSTAYALVSLVGPDVGGSSIVGIYRIDGPTSSTVVADIGAYSVAHPPATDYFVPTGVQYAMEPYRGGFLVTDGHHNRVLEVSLDGEISEIMTFDNIVPTGLAVSGNTIYMAEAGPTPHEPEHGKVVAFEPGATQAVEIASGAPLLVDVEFGRGRTLFALSQGTWDGQAAGSPALPLTGSLVEINRDGSVSVVAAPLSMPTSMEILGRDVYVVNLLGEIWKISGVGSAPYGRSGAGAP